MMNLMFRGKEKKYLEMKMAPWSLDAIEIRQKSYCAKFKFEKIRNGNIGQIMRKTAKFSIFN